MFHSGNAAHEPSDFIGGIPVAMGPRCIVDALRWNDFETTIPTICRLLDAGDVSAGHVDAIVTSESDMGGGIARVRSAWAAISRVRGSASRP